MRYGKIMALRASVGGSLCSPFEEVEQQAAHFGRLLLLHPMAGAVDQMAAEHLRAAAALHRFERAWALIGAPILLARDEAGGHVDAAPRKQRHLVVQHPRRAVAIPLQ